VNYAQAFLAGLLLLPGATHAQVYRCEQNGKLAFSDQPCTAGAKASQKTYAPSPASGAVDLDIPIKHYAVQGATYEALSQSLKNNGPKGFHGLSSWRIDYEYTTRKLGGGCQVDTVKVKVGGEILMPRWTDEASGPSDLQRRWSTYYAALRQHEDGHIQHGRELALLIRQRLLGLGVQPCEQMQALTEGEFKRLSGNLKARDEDYDARTNHGATQGARF
jgi:predicted secreted Zn-dependent protease